MKIVVCNVVNKNSNLVRNRLSQFGICRVEACGVLIFEPLPDYVGQFDREVEQFLSSGEIVEILTKTPVV